MGSRVSVVVAAGISAPLGDSGVGPVAPGGCLSFPAGVSAGVVCGDAAGAISPDGGGDFRRGVSSSSLPQAVRATTVPRASPDRSPFREGLAEAFGGGRRLIPLGLVVIGWRGRVCGGGAFG